MKKRKTSYAFFLQHAGYCYDPAIETPIEGRRRCARALAEAERRGLELGLVAEWGDDPDPDASWLEDESLYDAEDRDCARFSYCVIEWQGKVLASLSGIHEDSRHSFDDYRRVVRAELFQEALDMLGALPAPSRPASSGG